MMLSHDKRLIVSNSLQPRLTSARRPSTKSIHPNVVTHAGIAAGMGVQSRLCVCVRVCVCVCLSVCPRSNKKKRLKL